MTNVKTPHKHAEVFKAWADGRSVQYRVNEEDKWKDSKSLSFTDPYMQSYLTDPPLDDNGDCIYYWPIETHLKGKKDGKRKEAPQTR